MISRVVVKPKICSLYNLPEQFICIDPQCIAKGTFCAKCAKFEHPHLENVLTFEGFQEKIEEIIEKAQSKCGDRDNIPNIAALVKNKKH